MIRAALILMVLLMIPFGPAGAGAAPAALSVAALGSADLIDGQRDASSQEKAVSRALRSALIQSLDHLLGRKRLTDSLALLAAPVLENPTVYIQGFSIQSTTETGKRLYVLVSADVNTQALKAALGSLGLGRAGMKTKLLPLVVVAAGYGQPFAWWQTPDLPPPTSHTLDAMFARLTDLGVTVMPSRIDEPLDMDAEPDARQAAETGRKLEADLVLVGWLSEMETADGRASRASLWIVDPSTGQVVVGPLDLAVPEPEHLASAAASGGMQPGQTAAKPVVTDGQNQAPTAPPAATADSDDGRQPVDDKAFTEAEPESGEGGMAGGGQTEAAGQAGGGGMNESAGAGAPSEPSGADQPSPLPVRPDWEVLTDPQAWPAPVSAEEAGIRLAGLLADGISNAGWVLPIKPRQIKIEVSGVTRYLDLKAFLGGLARFPEQVQDVRQQSIRAGKATFSARLLTPAANLADLLTAQDFPTFFVTVAEVTDDLIRIELVQK